MSSNFVYTVYKQFLYSFNLGKNEKSIKKIQTTMYVGILYYLRRLLNVRYNITLDHSTVFEEFHGVFFYG